MASISDSDSICCCFRPSLNQVQHLPLPASAVSSAANAVFKPNEAQKKDTPLPLSPSLSAASKPKVSIPPINAEDILVQAPIKPIMTCNSIDYLYEQFKDKIDLVKTLALTLFNKSNCIRLIFDQTRKVSAISKSVLDFTGFTPEEMMLGNAGLDQIVSLADLFPGSTSDTSTINLNSHINMKRSFVSQTFLHLKQLQNPVQMDHKSLKAHIYIFKSQSLFVALIHKTNDANYAFQQDISKFFTALSLASKEKNDSLITSTERSYYLTSIYDDAMNTAFRTALLSLEKYQLHPLASTTTMLLICDKELKILAITKNMESHLGFKAEHIIQRNLTAFTTSLATEDQGLISSTPTFQNAELASPKFHTITTSIMTTRHIPSPTLKPMNGSPSQHSQSTPLSKHSLSPSNDYGTQIRLNVTITIQPLKGYSLLIIEFPNSQSTPANSLSPTDSATRLSPNNRITIDASPRMINRRINTLVTSSNSTPKAAILGMALNSFATSKPTPQLVSTTTFRAPLPTATPANVKESASTNSPNSKRPPRDESPRRIIDGLLNSARKSTTSPTVNPILRMQKRTSQLLMVPPPDPNAHYASRFDSSKRASCPTPVTALPPTAAAGSAAAISARKVRQVAHSAREWNARSEFQNKLKPLNTDLPQKKREIKNPSRFSLNDNGWPKSSIVRSSSAD